MKRFGAVLLLLGVLFLGGCGGRPAARAPADVALQTAGDSGRQALELGRLKQASAQYQEAFKLALARDEGSAIAAAGYNLAVVELAGNDAAGALRTAVQTRDALAARDAAGFAELDLVQAAALHRLGREAAADSLAARAEATADDLAVRARASYVRGLVADARGDAAGVAAALAGFGQPEAPPPDWQADHDEVAARLALLRGQFGQAAALAQHAADVHRTQLNYRAMADALVVAARAREHAGLSRDAADLYLQAGESAASRGDDAAARKWLRQASLPGASATTRHAAVDVLNGLRVGAAGSVLAGDASHPERPNRPQHLARHHRRLQEQARR